MFKGMMPFTSKKEPIFERNYQGSLRAREHYSREKNSNDLEISKPGTHRFKKNILEELKINAVDLILWYDKLEVAVVHKTVHIDDINALLDILLLQRKELLRLLDRINGSVLKKYDEIIEIKDETRKVKLNTFKEEYLESTELNSLRIQYDNLINKMNGGGGAKTVVKKTIKKIVCGKLRCIYKIPGSRKEHLKYKGQLITVADYKKLMKAKSI